ncbi:DUF6342 family protein [Streptomyces sp. NPDC093111]|uniref:DUF6342 family protein n=1 Tax=Streptomyces sp. NPDC093111 TaxID=3154978 RepID=UPI003446D34E
MADIDLGVATDWNEGDTHARIALRQNHVNPKSQDILISSPVSIELSVNSNFSSNQEGDKIFFTTHIGSTKKIIGILDSEGNLHIAGRLITEQKDLSY